MNIYKLKYMDELEAITDLKNKEVIDDNGLYINGTHSVVYLPTETSFDVDIMTEIEYDFGDKIIIPLTPNHMFYGW